MGSVKNGEWRGLGSGEGRGIPVVGEIVDDAESAEDLADAPRLREAAAGSVGGGAVVHFGEAPLP